MSISPITSKQESLTKILKGSDQAPLSSQFTYHSQNRKTWKKLGNCGIDPTTHRSQLHDGIYLLSAVSYYKADDKEYSVRGDGWMERVSQMHVGICLLPTVSYYKVDDSEYCKGQC